MVLTTKAYPNLMFISLMRENPWSLKKVSKSLALASGLRRPINNLFRLGSFLLIVFVVVGTLIRCCWWWYFEFENKQMNETTNVRWNNN